MIKNCIVLFAIFSFHWSWAQKAPAEDLKWNHKNIAVFELGGPGLFYSLNYERILINAPRFKTSLQVGGSFYPKSTGTINLWLPITLQEIYSINPRNSIEIGAGIVPIREYSEGLPGYFDEYWAWGDPFYTARLGYRRFSEDQKWITKFSFTPIFEIYDGILMHPTGALSLGYCF